MYSNLKSLIKAIRATKTLAEERALITKESASIRASFRSEDAWTRHACIEKLLYIHMLGYPAHFGQIECLKLVASARYSDKRLGYLGIMLLLDEVQEVLMLVTNSLKNDMNSSNLHAVGLALCTFADIASEEMSRDLADEITRLLGTSEGYVRKKACLCATRIIHKVPELIPDFIKPAKDVLSDRHHGVLLCGLTLLTDMCALSEEACQTLRNQGTVRQLVKIFKQLLATGFSPEHDVSGVTDPFLQVKLLRLLRYMGKGDADASETMNDILAQVATNTESSKNVGNAILYEATITILEIEADSGLRVMAINILGKFLGNRDNNIRRVISKIFMLLFLTTSRYVALHTLHKVVAMDTQAVQRHRNIILDCLRDGDISIRRRALDLTYALVNESNVKIMIRELLAFLEIADQEFKLGVTTQIALAAERFAPNKRWHIDTVLRVLELAGNYVREEILSSFIRLVAHTPELQSYTVQRLYKSLMEDTTQEALTLAAVWCIGEFGDILITDGPDGNQDSVITSSTQSKIIDLLSKILNSPYSHSESSIRAFILTSAVKLCARFAEMGSPDSDIQQLKELISQYSQSPELEIQARSAEFTALLLLDSTITDGVLERMPPPEIKTTVMGVVSENKPVGSTSKEINSTTETTPRNSKTNNHPAKVSHLTQDLLADIFGGSSTSSAAARAEPAGDRRNDMNDLLGLFDLKETASSSDYATEETFKGDLYSAFSANGLSIELEPRRLPRGGNQIQIIAYFKPTTDGELTDIIFQAAVPKSQTLQMQPISSSNIRPQTKGVTQQMIVTAPIGAQIRLRLKVAFSLASGERISDQVDFSGFPADIMS